MNGWAVIAKYTTQWETKGEPVKRDGHFKIYATRKAADRRRYSLGSNWTEVKPIRYEVQS